MLRFVSAKKLSDLWHLRDCQSWAPLVLQNVKAYRTIRIDIAMVDLRSELDLGWFKRVVRREVDVQEEYSTLIRRTLRTHDGGLPIELVITSRSCRAAGRRVPAKLL